MAQSHLPPFAVHEKKSASERQVNTEQASMVFSPLTYMSKRVPVLITNPRSHFPRYKAPNFPQPVTKLPSANAVKPSAPITRIRVPNVGTIIVAIAPIFTHGVSHQEVSSLKVTHFRAALGDPSLPVPGCPKALD
ncbi:hypothetical protein Nepgr_024126 [Nepenthes gracilis]|uniref:Uncharacterized protein n=1 Tax=Nepenthes gracilis TaxID=150966 RepID=A0AAD3T3G3_NEPGR|nr:hypothetical protein Nepgr_024126 [Nepenthes gracilis]